MKLLIKQFSPFSNYSNPLRSSYLPEHLILENAQPMFLSNRNQVSHTHVKQQGKLSFRFF